MGEGERRVEAKSEGDWKVEDWGGPEGGGNEREGEKGREEEEREGGEGEGEREGIGGGEGESERNLVWSCSYRFLSSCKRALRASSFKIKSATAFSGDFGSF